MRERLDNAALAAVAGVGTVPMRTMQALMPAIREAILAELPADTLYFVLDTLHYAQTATCDQEDRTFWNQAGDAHLKLSLLLDELGIVRPGTPVEGGR